MIKQFLNHLSTWESTLERDGDATAYLPIEPKLLLVETTPDGAVHLRRLSFRCNSGFLAYQQEMTTHYYSPLSVMLLDREVQIHQAESVSSSALALGASLLFSCLSEAEIFTVLSTHMGRPIDANAVNAYELMMFPLFGSDVLSRFLEAQVAENRLHRALAVFLGVVLIVDPAAREDHIRQFLAAPTVRPRPI